MGRKPCCDKVGLKRGPWTIEEDHKLMNFVMNNGIHCWRTVPKLAGLLRCGKSCRLRWINYLRPDLKRGGFTEDEEAQIIQLHADLGNRWSKIASHFNGRTDNEIKNHWNTKIKKTLKAMGVDPVSHKPVETTQTAKEESLPVAESMQNHDMSTEDGAIKKLAPISSDNASNETADTYDLFSSYEIFNGTLEVIEHWLNEDSIEPDDSSPSASLGDSFSGSMSELSQDSLLQKQSGSDSFQIDDACYLHQWVDELDALYGFNFALDNDQLFYPGHNQ